MHVLIHKDLLKLLVVQRVSNFDEEQQAIILFSCHFQLFNASFWNKVSSMVAAQIDFGAWMACTNTEVSLWIMMISVLLVSSEHAALPVMSLAVPHVQQKDRLVRQRTNVMCSRSAAGFHLWFWVGHLATEPSLTAVTVHYVTDWSRVGSLRICA